jgi:hypothetical protein
MAENPGLKTIGELFYETPRARPAGAGRWRASRRRSARGTHRAPVMLSYIVERVSAFRARIWCATWPPVRREDPQTAPRDSCGASIASCTSSRARELDRAFQAEPPPWSRSEDGALAVRLARGAMAALPDDGKPISHRTWRQRVPPRTASAAGARRPMEGRALGRPRRGKRSRDTR